jgi:hypothetical protein
MMTNWAIHHIDIILSAMQVSTPKSIDDDPASDLLDRPRRSGYELPVPTRKGKEPNR